MGTSAGARKGHTPESDAKRRAAMIARWHDPEYRAKRAALEATPEMREARSSAMQEANNRPEKRQRHSEFMKEKFATDEEYREQQRAWIQRAADDPVIQQARSEAMKQAWVQNPAAFAGSLRASLEDAQSEAGRARRREVYARRAAASPITPYEHIVSLVLNDLEVPYFMHKVAEGKEMDVLVPSLSLDIEVDGVNHVGKGALRDSKRDAYLAERGYAVLRLKHGEILNGAFIVKLQRALGLTAA